MLTHALLHRLRVCEQLHAYGALLDAHAAALYDNMYGHDEGMQSAGRLPKAKREDDGEDAMDAESEGSADVTVIDSDSE